MCVCVSSCELCTLACHLLTMATREGKCLHKTPSHWCCNKIPRKIQIIHTSYVLCSHAHHLSFIYKEELIILRKLAGICCFCLTKKKLSTGNSIAPFVAKDMSVNDYFKPRCEKKPILLSTR